MSDVIHGVIWYAVATMENQTGESFSGDSALQVPDFSRSKLTAN